MRTRSSCSKALCTPSRRLCTPKNGTYHKDLQKDPCCEFLESSLLLIQQLSRPLLEAWELPERCLDPATDTNYISDLMWPETEEDIEASAAGTLVRYCDKVASLLSASADVEVSAAAKLFGQHAVVTSLAYADSAANNTIRTFLYTRQQYKSTSADLTAYGRFMVATPDMTAEQTLVFQARAAALSLFESDDSGKVTEQMMPWAAVSAY